MKLLINILTLIYITVWSLAFAIPPNSYHEGTGWKCKSGYKKQGQQCNKIYVPPNALLKGNKWVCRSGFKRIGQQCNKISSHKNNGITLEVANELFDSGKHKEAIVRYKALAKTGNIEAQFILGVIYNTGSESVPTDHILAAKWFEQAAQNGHSEAQQTLGFLYDKGEGVLKNAKKSFYWIEKSAYQGSADAQELLGTYHVLGKGTLKDINQAFRWYLKAAQQGVDTAQYNVAKYYCFGIGKIQQNFYKCSEWAKRSHNNGNTDAPILWEEYELWKYQ